MGCSGSKVERQRAVALCRGRADLLAAAIRHRDALAAAHSAYADSLLSVSAALHRLLLLLPPSPSSSPVLPLPARRKPEPSPPPPLVSSGDVSHRGSHINFFPSDSDDDDEDDEEDDDDSPFHSGGSFPVHQLHHYGAVPGGTGFDNIYYARSQPPPPSVAVQQPLQNYETVQVGSFEPYAAYPSYGYPYGNFPGYYGAAGRFFGHQAMPPPTTMATSTLGAASSSRAPPPPPSPPRTSAWDFFNPFQNYDNYYYRSTPSRSSQEVRDEEGIPDLEEDDQEVMVGAYSRQNFAAFSSAAAREEYTSMGASAARDRGMNSIGEGSCYYQSRSAAAAATDAAGRNSNFELEVVDKNVVTNEVQRPRVEQRNVTARKNIVGDSDVADAIKAQFQRASQCVRELSELLEVRNHQHHPKQSIYEDDQVISSKSLASTLQKLYVWERKLYHEVRAEEKMRLLLSKSHKELRHLVERGVETDKIDLTRNLIKKLSTKIRIAIQVVHSISRKINKLRDEELWPQITEFILGIVRMWNIMLECHQMQCQSISEAKRLDLVVCSGKLSSILADEILQLEMEMLKWTSNFFAWVNAQRNYVKALNGWLVLCLHHEPEETANGIPSYSPGKIGAPPVFIICNCWSQTMDRTSEREVLDSMQAFASAVHHQWEQQNIEQNERMIAIRDRDRWLRAMDKKKKDIHKEVDSLNKKLALVPGQIRLSVSHQMFEGHTAEISSMQLGLEKVFEAMEDFSAGSVKAYEELLEHCGEQRMARETARFS